VKGDQEVYGVYAMAQLELLGMRVLPSGAVSQPMKPGQTLTFTWQVDAGFTGAYMGTMWMSLHMVPLDGSESFTRTISAQRFEVGISKMLGLDGRTARQVGFMGLGLSVVLGVVDLGQILHRLRRRTGLNR